MQLIIKVLLFGKSYTFIYLTPDSFTLSNLSSYKEIGIPFNGNQTLIDVDESVTKRRLFLRTNALFLQPLLKECASSTVYRQNVLNNMYEFSECSKQDTVFLKLILEPPDRDIMDYAWNDRMLKLVWSRVEIENAFSWLSTLGGAYSALGDYFDYCAEEAGRISQRQYKLSKMLGDDGLAARSRLYSALSYSQKGQLKLARHIVRSVSQFAVETHDRRLSRMCQGVWAKLKYLRKLKHINRKDSGDEIASNRRYLD